MRHTVRFLPLFLVALAENASAAMYYVSPEGTADADCSRYTPCALSKGTTTAIAGDTVILTDGVYHEQLFFDNSGTPDAWITFQADECATPILEGPGYGPTEDNQDSGVYSATGNYVRFIGLVSRGWNTGFGNGWTAGDDHSIVNLSNGHLEFKNCIADGNGRTGFTFFSAPSLHIQNSISSHNGSSTKHSWSSGITLYQAQGSNVENVVEGSISFENMDAQKHTDGSGFIVDEGTQGASFINNIAFRNGGSCLRLTKSSNTRFINNTCYHNAQDPQDTGPTNPSELYFTDAPTRNGVSFMNNILVATGMAPRAAMPVVNQPMSGWSNNISTTGSVDFFTGADGANPDFTLLSSASTAIGQGAEGATNDSGFDPKCIVKQAPVLVGSVAKGDWWEYSIDIEYIKQLGGVARCFNPQPRSAPLDIGAYVAAGVTRNAVCVPPPPPVPPVATAAPSVSADPAASTDAMGSAAPGTTLTPDPASTTPATPTTPSTASSAGVATSTSVPASSTDPGAATTQSPAGSGAVTSAPSSTDASAVGSGAPVASPGSVASNTPPGCACRVVGPTGNSGLTMGWAALALSVAGLARRRGRGQRG